MTWEELKEKAKGMGDRCKDENIISFKKHGLYFNCYKYGSISIADTRANDITVKDRTPEQMLMIMRGLE